MVEAGRSDDSGAGREASRDEPVRAAGPVPLPAPTAPASTTAHSASASAAHRERQTLLLMLLAQVCSLHDATPRTFVVHVLALFERGILDEDSIRFLFELGLVPGAAEAEGGKEDENEAESSSVNSASGAMQDCFGDSSALAIVPYCPSDRHPWSRYLPASRGAGELCLDRRRKEATAIRRHLERHESLDGSGGFGSALSANDEEAERTGSAPTDDTYAAEESFAAAPAGANTVHRIPDADTDNLRPLSPWSVERHPLSLSRYARDFTDISPLAAGAFGAVYRAVHKLESKAYAVKVVRFRAEGYYAETLGLVVREVRCLAALDHANCVRYYTSWLEPSWMTGDQIINDNYPEEDYSDENACGRENARRSPKLLEDIERAVNGCRRSDDLEHGLEAILYGEEKNDGFDWVEDSKRPSERRLSALSFERSGSGDAVSADWRNLPSHQTNNPSVYSLSSADADDSDVSEWTRELEEADESQSLHWDSKYSSESMELVKTEQRPHRDRPKNDDKPKMKQSSAAASSPYKYQICLFIQMQLCHPTTLSDWIKQRNSACLRFTAEEKQARARPAFLIFRQIVNGLEHVHSKGIIHRDLKPANIFAGDNGTWRIGDFGLSKMMREAHLVPLSPSNEFFSSRNFDNNGHTAGVGTASYAAPEQIAETHYGPEVDIFALGMILLELFSNFTSEHERAKAFHNCRHRRELEPWMHRTYPEVSALVLACTQPEWSRRPTTSDIRNAGVFHERGSCTELYRAELNSLKGEIAQRDSVIDEQKELLRAKDEEIEELRRRLSEMGGKKIDAKRAVDVDCEDGCTTSDDDY